ncbi:MAG: hypothetical protein KGK08_14850 [Acidobacteriota bacterium]|nr:hypothetical protein [Acidobacteriota bacterium]
MRTRPGDRLEGADAIPIEITDSEDDGDEMKDANKVATRAPLASVQRMTNTQQKRKNEVLQSLF